MQLATVAAEVETPAFVIDERVILHALDIAKRLRSECGCKILYTLKPLVLEFVLELIKPHVDGFAASSLFEARLARSVLGEGGTGSLHITTPGFRAGEIAELNRLCDYVAFNSLGQLERFAGELDGPAKTGLRVNPKLALVDDDRYNPCRAGSKLGVPIGQLRKRLEHEPELLERISGLHFHTNCDSESYAPLLETVRHLDKRLGKWLGSLRWLNLGGGYMLEDEKAFVPLHQAVDRLRSGYGLEVFFEPGAGFVRSSGFLISEVVDLFRSCGQNVAVLDTTINHFPEVFEYQFEPDVLGHVDDGPHEYLLAGSTCLAGDVLGEYAFAEPLHIGSRIILPNVGAYTTVKAHMFNGVNLPTVYSITSADELVLRRRYGYEDFLARCTDPTNAAV